MGADIKGLEDLNKTLDRLGEKIKTEVAIKGLRAGCAVIATEAKRLVPVETGLMRKSIRTRIIKSRKKNTQTGKVYVSRSVKGQRNGKDYKPGYIAHSVEYGHRIVVNGQAMGQAKPHPFLRPAKDQKKDAAVSAMADRMKAVLPEVVEKVKSKSGI